MSERRRHPNAPPAASAAPSVGRHVSRRATASGFATPPSRIGCSSSVSAYANVAKRP